MNHSTFIKNVMSFVLLTMAVFSFAQTGVKVSYYEGSTQNFNITETGKLFFSGDNLLIKTTATNPETSIPVSIIKKITFGDFLAVQTVGANDKNLQLYPNPSADFIRIKSTAKSLDVKIYSTEGDLVLSGTYKANENINVSRLNKGVYLVQVNGTTIKFIKK